MLWEFLSNTSITGIKMWLLQQVLQSKSEHFIFELRYNSLSLIFNLFTLHVSQVMPNLGSGFHIRRVASQQCSSYPHSKRFNSDSNFYSSSVCRIDLIKIRDLISDCLKIMPRHKERQLIHFYENLKGFQIQKLEQLLIFEALVWRQFSQTSLRSLNKL